MTILEVNEDEEYDNLQVGSLDDKQSESNFMMRRKEANTVHTTHKEFMEGNKEYKFDRTTKYMLDMSLHMSKNIRGLKLGNKIMSCDGQYIYHISIIDFLQKYTCSKRMERCYKRTFMSANGAELSSIGVKPYKQRFMKFMRDKIFNFDFNHNIDVCQMNKALEEMNKSELRNMKDDITKLNIFRNFDNN